MLAVVAIIAIVLASDSDSDDTTVSCQLTAAAASAVITGVTKGRGVEEIVAPVGAGLLVPQLCKPVVEALLEKPDTSVKLDITGADTGSLPLSGSELLGASAPPARAPTCDDWLFESARSACAAGQLAPPPVVPAS